MGRPADRVEGVVLVTDYGALDKIAEKMEEKKCGGCEVCECKPKNTPDYTEYWEGA